MTQNIHDAITTAILIGIIIMAFTSQNSRFKRLEDRVDLILGGMRGRFQRMEDELDLVRNR